MSAAGVDEPAHYTFPPIERRGVLLGLGGTQVGVLLAGALVALGTLRAGLGGTGMVLALAVLVLAGAAALLPLAGQPPAAWVPVAVTWLFRGRPRRLSTAPLAGSAGAAGSGAAAGWGPARGRRASEPEAPLAPPGVRIACAPAVPGDGELGMIEDRRVGAWSAVLPVQGRSLTLLDRGEQARRLASWGALLSGLARPGSPIHRIQWVERTVPADPDALRTYVDDCAVADAGSAAGRSYRELVTGEGPAAKEHQAFLVVSVRGRRAPHRPGARGHGAAMAEILRREVHLMRGQLRQADLGVSAPLDVAGLLAALAAGSDPPRRIGPGRAPGAGAGWPLAVEEHWGAVRVDGRWAATFWVADWPRVAVGPDFLSPLLLSGSRRTVSMTMVPIPTDRAIREVESARTADAADQQLRQRAGFLATARHEREVEGVLQRERELAEGHADYRYSGYVTVSGATRDELEAGCAEVEQAARQAFLTLRRLYGRQAEALTWTLPLGRGLS